MTETITSPPKDKSIECRALVHGGDVYLLSHKSGRWYIVDDDEFAARCQELGGGAPLEAEVTVRRAETSEHSSGGFNYLPHSQHFADYSVPLIVVGHERESFQVTGPGVGQQLLDQEFAEEVK